MKHSITTMKSTLLTAAFFGLTVTSGAMFSSETAEARPNTSDFTCSALRSTINQRGAVVFNTRNNRVFRRLVRNRSQCALVENTRNISVPTRDGRCRVRICHQPLGRSSR